MPLQVFRGSLRRRPAPGRPAGLQARRLDAGGRAAVRGPASAARRQRRGHEALDADECAGPRSRAAPRAWSSPTPARPWNSTCSRPERRAEPFAASVARIQRLGHVVWTTPRHREAIAFFRDVLNFAQSDSIGEMITFFRAFPNPYHHGIGIAQGSERKLQSPQLHGHRDRRCRPWPRALQGEGGAGGVRARPPSGLDQRVPVLPRSRRHDARIQLRHGGVSRGRRAGAATPRAGAAQLRFLGLLPRSAHVDRRRGRRAHVRSEAR